MQLVEASFGRSLFVLGGARSGKSRHAQAVAEAVAGRHSAQLVYVATAQSFDGEMEERIARHQADRDGRWRTIEAPIALADALASEDRPDVVMLVDCLTLWTSNLLLKDAPCTAQFDELIRTLDKLQGRVVLVSNEVGQGIVPDNALARRFRDAAGLLHQRVAACVDSVDIVMAGIAQRWKAHHGD